MGLFCLQSAAAAQREAEERARVAEEASLQASNIETALQENEAEQPLGQEPVGEAKTSLV